MKRCTLQFQFLEDLMMYRFGLSKLLSTSLFKDPDNDLTLEPNFRKAQTSHEAMVRISSARESREPTSKAQATWKTFAL